MKEKNEDLWGRICWGSALWGRILPCTIEWEWFVGKDSFAFWGKKAWLFPMWGRIASHFWEESLTSYPCGEEFVEKNSFAFEGFQGQEGLTPSPCGEGFVGRDSCAFRGKRKFDSSIALYFRERKSDSFPMCRRIYREGKFVFNVEEFQESLLLPNKFK